MHWAPAKQPNKVENFFITYRKYFRSVETASTAPRSKLVLAPSSKSTPVQLGAPSGGCSNPPPTSHRAVIVPPPLGPGDPAARPARPRSPRPPDQAQRPQFRTSLGEAGPGPPRGRGVSGPRGRGRGRRCQSPRGARAARLRIRPPPGAG